MSAARTDNDFGAENVASNPATARTTRPSANVRSFKGRPSGDPVLGSRPDSTASRSSVLTVPVRPRAVAWFPVHTPGMSSGDSVKYCV